MFTSLRKCLQNQKMFTNCNKCSLIQKIFRIFVKNVCKNKKWFACSILFLNFENDHNFWKKFLKNLSIHRCWLKTVLLRALMTGGGKGTSGSYSSDETSYSGVRWIVGAPDSNSWASSTGEPRTCAKAITRRQQTAADRLRQGWPVARRTATR